MTRRAGWLALLLLFLGATALLMRGQGAQNIEDTVAQFAAREEISGGVIAFGKTGEAPLLHAFGKTPVTGEAIRTGDRFRIASLSKPLTAAAVVEAAQRADISLNSPMARILPEFASTADRRMARITLADLLRHSGGWDREIDADPLFLSAAERATMFGTTPDSAPADCSAIARAGLSRPLQFDPGARHAYSNIGYCWLGLWLEKVTGKSYPDAVHALVPEAAGFTLDPALLDVVPAVPEEAAAWPVMNAAAIAPAGGWIADAATYFAFAGRKIAAEQAIRPTYGEPEEYYGMGWRFWRIDGVRYRTHYGAMPGVFSVVIVREDGQAVVALFAGSPSDYDSAFADLFARIRMAAEWQPASAKR